MRTGSNRSRLQQTRDSLAGIPGDAYVQNAVVHLDSLLSADVWNEDGSAKDPGFALQKLASAAGELASTDAETYMQADGVFTAALDIAQAAIVKSGGLTAATSKLIADADHEMLIGHPDTAIALLIEVGEVLPPVVSNNLASQGVQYSDSMQEITITATDATVDFPLTATTEWSLNGGAFQAGLPSWLTLSQKACNNENVWGICTWTLAGTGPVPASAGSYVIRATATSTHDYSYTDVNILVKPEDAFILYTGETISQIGKDLTLRATVWDSATAGYAGLNPEVGETATIGDVSMMWVAFDIYSMDNCLSGIPLMTQYAQVADTGNVGDGIGFASSIFNSISEASYCVSARLVSGSDGGVNAWYTADSTDAVLTFYEPSGQFATGGGWISDSDGGKGNLGFTGRYLKNGKTQGNVVYIYRGIYQGEQADFRIKSTALSALAFGGTDFPVQAILQGKCTIQVIRSSDGTVLYSDGNATFQAFVSDGGDSVNVDTFSLVVYDKNGVIYKSVPETPLQGGNILVHK